MESNAPYWSRWWFYCHDCPFTDHWLDVHSIQYYSTWNRPREMISSRCPVLSSWNAALSFIFMSICSLLSFLLTEVWEDWRFSIGMWKMALSIHASISPIMSCLRSCRFGRLTSACSRLTRISLFTSPGTWLCPKVTPSRLHARSECPLTQSDSLCTFSLSQRIFA